MRIPWGTPSVSDASKLELIGSLGQRLYRLRPQVVETQNFNDNSLPSGWTEVDSGGKVNFQNNRMEIDGNNVLGANSVYTSQRAVAPTLLSFTCTFSHNAPKAGMGFNNTPNNFTEIYHHLYAFVEAMHKGKLNASTGDNGPDLADSVEYTFRFYYGYDCKSATSGKLTIQGGAFTSETLVGEAFFDSMPASWYFCWTTVNTGRPFYVDNFSWASGYDTGGEYLTYVADAGKIISVSAVGTMDATDLEGPNGSPTGAVQFTGGATGILRSYNAVTGKANIHTISGTPQTGTVTCTATGHTFTISDIGVQAAFQGFDFTRFAAIGSWATTNAKFRYAVDGGAASAWKTLAELQAVGKLAGPYRVVLDVQLNSDGATQQYGGEVNAPDCTEGVGDFPTASNVLSADTVQGITGTAASGSPLISSSIILSAASVAVGGTLTVTGGVTSDQNVTGATVTLTRKRKSDGATVATLINSTYDLVAATQKTWAAMLGTACTFTPATAQEEYLECTVSGGTPTITSETSGQATYAVTQIPSAPDITVARASDTTATVTFDGDAGVTNYAVLAGLDDMGDNWTAGGNRSGDGAVTVTVELGKSYLIQGYSVHSSGGKSNPSNVVLYTAGGASAATKAYGLFLEKLFAAIRDSAALAAKITDATPALHVGLGRKLWTDAATFETRIAQGPMISVRPQTRSKDPRTMDSNRCTFSAHVVVYESFTQSSDNTFIAATDFVEALTQELMAGADGAASSPWQSSYGFNVRFQITGPLEVDGERNVLGTEIVVTAGWVEDV